MKLSYPLALLLVVAASVAEAAPPRAPVPLDGSTIVLPDCRADECVSATKLVHDYAEAVPDSDEAFTIAGHCSPWRLYAENGRIERIGDLAQQIRAHPKFPGVREIALICSWSGVRPEGATASLASQMEAATGKRTTGKDGFLWLGPGGAQKTTHQSFTAYPGRYFARPGEPVMASAVFAMPEGFPQELERTRNAEGLRYAGVYADVFLLMPDVALARFEHAARYGDAISAYNAALMRLERGAQGDRERAEAFAKRATELGDKRAAALLNQFR